MNIKTRLMTQDDEGFIYNSWLKSCRGDSRKNSHEFYSTYTLVVQGLLAKEHVKVLIACDLDDESFIYGYIVSSQINGVPVIHYAYTKNSFRNFGVFKALLAEIEPGFSTEPVVVTYWPKRKEGFLKKFNFVFKPEIREV